MNSKSIKLSALALAVTGALCGTAQANDYQKYNLTAQKQIQSSVVNKKDQVLKAQVTNWLLKLDTPAAVQAQEFGVDASTIKAKAIAAQVSVEQSISSMDLPIEVITKTSLLVNSLVVKGSQKDVESLLDNPLISDIYPVNDYQLDVADSADYITATPLVENQLATGTGIKVAVLDTGIDYTHAAFGGEGTSEAYAAAVADPASVDWPQGQVQGGYDYINYDADPIDVDTSHGTHVSNSVNGIAPNVDLFVYSVCNNVSCPGLAQILALENAMDPDNNGDITDRVDVINMSLGGNYGDIANDAVGLFINQAVKLGTNVVISAGNDGAYPFIVGGPSTTENALSVGAMTHPATEVGVASGTVAGVEGDLQVSSFGPQEAYSISGADLDLVYPSANSNGCEEFAEDVDFTGKAVLIDRGACAFTDKVLNAQARGAEFVFIANNVDDGTPAPMGGFDANVTIKSLGINFAAGTALKAQLDAGEPATFDIAVEFKTTAGAIASFTSRGPSMGGLLKPEITAPGVDIMTATPGAGDGLAPISGTSFSSPITAGAISLLKEALPNRNAFELKATLMNTANLDVTMEPREINPEAELAPISYIGAGLVDVTKAANLPVAAWAKDTKQAALSFGLVSGSEKIELSKTVEVKNFSNEVKVYTLSLEQRYQNDIDRGSFALDYPETITVPAGQTISFDVTATIDPATLPEWTLDAGNVGSLDATSDLTNLELDGALIFSDGSDPAFHLVYHALPKANAAISIAPEMTEEGPSHTLTNTGATAFEPVFAPLTATGEVNEELRFDIVGASIETLAVPSEVCAEGFVTLTTMIFNEGITHTYVGGFMADFDLDQDGIYDVTVQNGMLEWFYDVEPGSAITFTHGYGSGSGNLNNIYQVVGNNHFTLQSCIGAFGLTAADIGSVTADVRFRTEEETWTPIATEQGDTVVASYTFNDASEDVYAALVDESGNQINKLEVGESATLLSANTDFVILSASGSSPYVATPAADASMPPLLEDAAFSVDENTADGTVIGMLEATYAADFANPVAEYIVTSSTSTAITVNATGEVVVANSQVLDYDSGLESVELEVVVADTSGNISEPAKVVVTVNNLADEESEQPVEATPPSSNSSSGSLAWLTLLAAPFAFLRRRKKK